MNARGFKLFAATAAVLITLGSGSLRADPITGLFNFSGTVTVGAKTITFKPSVPPASGKLSTTDSGNTGSFTVLDTSAKPKYDGTIKNLNTAVEPVNSPFLLPNFIALAALPNARFDLTFIEPGVFTSALCYAPAAAGDTCTPTGSAFSFVDTSKHSSTVSFVVDGTVTNLLTGQNSFFNGVFTAQFANKSYQDLLASVAKGHPITTSYSATFDVSAVPEPSSVILFGSTLLGLGIFSVRRSRRARNNLAA